MNNLKSIALQTQSIDPRHPLPLYYSFSEKEVYTNPGDGRFHVTNLINPNTPEDIEEVITRWKNM